MTLHWKQRPEGGGRFALWLIRAIALHLGRWPARLLLFPITAYFLLVRGPERRASRAYLARVHGRPPTLWEVARHKHVFASTILDRVFLLSGRMRDFDVQIFGLEQLHRQMDHGKGVLLFGSHHGSFEVLRVLSRERPDVQVKVLMDRGQNQAITCLLEALNPEVAATVIDAAQDGPSIVLAMRDAASEQALIAMLADRARPGEPCQPCRFLGGQAMFPTAPMLIAATLHLPVVLCFGLYRGGRRYDLHFELFSEGLQLPRATRREMLTAELQRYADRLEHYVRLAPMNWFNFYDFWNGDDALPRSETGDRAGAAVADAAANHGAQHSG